MATVSDLNLLTGSSVPLLASGDVLAFTDISDATQSPGGSTVKATMTQFFAAIPAPIIITSTTATQFQVKYDGSNHVTVAVSSAGAVTLNATGASAGFTFSDPVICSGLLTANTLTSAAGTALTFQTGTAGTVLSFASNGATATFGGGVAIVSTSSLTIGGAFSGATTGTFSDHLSVAAAKKVYFNGQGGNTNLVESSAGTFILTVGGTALATWTTLLTLNSNLDVSGGLSVGAAAVPNHGIAFGTSAPGVLADGQIWYDGTNLKARLGGATKTITVA